MLVWKKDGGILALKNSSRKDNRFCSKSFKLKQMAFDKD